MDVAAAFLSLFAGPVDAHNWRSFDVFTTKITAMAILREATIESMTLLWGQFKLVVVVGKGEDADF